MNARVLWEGDVPVLEDGKLVEPLLARVVDTGEGFIAEAFVHDAMGEEVAWRAVQPDAVGTIMGTALREMCGWLAEARAKERQT